ncbi:unnamed protein product [marine sediment metagenome]|uniref:Uncharacterized protein n=1 Tax=marine sediment metagenome TaxID=412755 RepID=X0Z4V9_9ZZZZ
MKFTIEIIYTNQIFIGIGFILGKDYLGVAISNLFIGFKKYEKT